MMFKIGHLFCIFNLSIFNLLNIVNQFFKLNFKDTPTLQKNSYPSVLIVDDDPVTRLLHRKTVEAITQI